jgi:hypothetical protein
MPKNHDGWIQSRCIIEMLGAPKEHLDQTLKDFVKMLKDDKELEVVAEEYADPLEQDSMFTTFVELEIHFKDIPRLLNFCFEAMTSSVEILDPETIMLPAHQLSSYLNDMQLRLHTLDSALKKIEVEHTLLGKNAEALFRNLVILSLEDHPKDLATLSSDLGIAKSELEPLLEQMAKISSIKLVDGKYSREVHKNS